MGYRVIKFFFDLTDSAHEYHEGDSYPRKGLAVSDARIRELLSGKNRLRTPLIEEVKVAKKKKGA